jgi:hypothetical protein
MHVDSGVDTMHAVKGVGTVDFQLESGGSLKVAEVSHVPELRVNFLSVSALADKGYAVMFEDGHVLIWSERAYLGCNNEAWHQARYDVQVVGMTCVGVQWISGFNSVSESGQVARERELIPGT